MNVLFLSVIFHIYCRKWSNPIVDAVIKDLPYIKLGEFKKGDIIWFNGWIDFAHYKKSSCFILYREGKNNLLTPDIPTKYLNKKIYFNGSFKIGNVEKFKIRFGCEEIKDTSIYKSEIYIYKVENLQDLVNHKKLKKMFKYH